MTKEKKLNKEYRRLNLSLDKYIAERVEKLMKTIPAKYTGLIENLLVKWCIEQENIQKVLNEPSNAKKIYEVTKKYG